MLTREEPSELRHFPTCFGMMYSVSWELTGESLILRYHADVWLSLSHF